MNKIFLFAVILGSSLVNLDASSKPCTYEFNCNNPGQIIKVYSDGREEIITVESGENARDKIKELRDQGRSGASKSAESNKHNFTTFGCFSSNRKFVNSENAGSSTIPTYYLPPEKIEEMTERDLNMDMIVMMLRSINQATDRVHSKKK